MKQGAWRVQSLRKFGLYFVKHKNNMHTPAACTPVATGCLVF